MSKRNKRSGRFEPQYKKSSFVVNHVTLYLQQFGWQKRLMFLFNPHDFIVDHVAPGLYQKLKQLEDKDRF